MGKTMKRTDALIDYETGEPPSHHRPVFVTPVAEYTTSGSGKGAGNGRANQHPHKPRVHAGLSAAELRLAEEAWAALPSFDDLVKGRR